MSKQDFLTAYIDRLEARELECKRALDKVVTLLIQHDSTYEAVLKCDSNKSVRNSVSRIIFNRVAPMLIEEIEDLDEK